MYPNILNINSANQSYSELHNCGINKHQTTHKSYRTLAYLSGYKHILLETSKIQRETQKNPSKISKNPSRVTEEFQPFFTQIIAFVLTIVRERKWYMTWVYFLCTNSKRILVGLSTSHNFSQLKRRGGNRPPVPPMQAFTAFRNLLSKLSLSRDVRAAFPLSGTQEEAEHWNKYGKWVA